METLALWHLKNLIVYRHDRHLSYPSHLCILVFLLEICFLLHNLLHLHKLLLCKRRFCPSAIEFKLHESISLVVLWNSPPPLYFSPLLSSPLSSPLPQDTAVLSVLATDPDKNRTVVYSVEGEPGELVGLVGIDRDSGQIVVSNQFLSCM